MARPLTPRAAGRSRLDLDDVPADVRSWLDEALGSPVVSAQTRMGGFSPGVAARVVGADGRRGFVKAVGDEVNSHTPDLFRHEIAVLSVLPEVPYRATLLASYDDGSWVAMLLDDVEGAFPDLDDDRDMAVVHEAVVAQCAELTPDPVGLQGPDLAESAVRWHRLVERTIDEDPSHFPGWFVSERDAVLARLASLPDRLPAESWVHLDVRDDNLLVRPDGSAVVLDWGMSRSGPSWTDQVLLAAHRVDRPVFDDLVSGLAAYGASAQRGAGLQDDVTDLLLALGGSLAALRDRPVPGLPDIDEFRRREQVRLLEGARRRLGA
ncbi:MAG: phosphotransferase [Candidatus Nanopelagicales bacterium]